MANGKSNSEPQLLTLRRDPIKHWLVWWRPSGCNTYYPINYKKIVKHENLDVNLFRLAMNELLWHETVRVKGVYNSEERKLIVYGLPVKT